MRELYTCHCPACAAKEDNTDISFNLDNRVLENVLRRIYEKFDVKHDIDPDLFSHTWTKLNEAVDEGVSVKFSEPNKDFIQELKTNNAVFAAFKTHRQQNDLASLLTDDKGKLRSYNDFRKATEPIVGDYNVNWLKTEYTTAVRSARTAARFRGYMKDKDLFPNLKWLPSRAAHPREAHMRYYDNVRSISDPWWKTHYPGCVWGCQCDMENTKEAITHRGDNPVPGAEPTPDTAGDIPTRDAGIERNPAFTGSIFTDSHPYVKGAYPGAEQAVKEKMIEITKEDLSNWYKQNMPSVKVGKFKAKRFEVETPDADEKTYINRRFYEEVISKYKDDPDYAVRLEWAKKAHLLFPRAHYVREEKSRHHPDSIFKVYEYKDKGTTLEFKCKVNRDGVFLFFMRIK